MRYLIFIVITIICLKSLANTKEFDSQTAKEYLSSSKAILLVYKLDGNLSPDDYVSIFQDVERNMSQDEIFKLWQGNIRNSIPNRFLVLKSYSGEFNVGDYIYAYESSSYPGIIERNDISLVFLRENRRAELNFTPCRVVTSGYLSKSFLKLGSKNEVIEYVIGKKPNLCFSEEELVK